MPGEGSCENFPYFSLISNWLVISYMHQCGKKHMGPNMFFKILIQGLDIQFDTCARLQDEAQHWAPVEPGSNHDLRCAKRQLINVGTRTSQPPHLHSTDRPDITVMVGWELKINYLSIYPLNRNTCSQLDQLLSLYSLTGREHKAQWAHFWWRIVLYKNYPVSCRRLHISLLRG